MTYLQLCQALRREAGIQGTGPTAVTGQVKEYLAVVEWVAQAWTDIQTARRNWKFMWSNAWSKATVVGQSELDISSDSVARFDEETFTFYETAVGTSDRQYLYFEPWHESKTYIKSISSGNQMPSIITRYPSGNLTLIYPTDKIYTIEADTYREAQLFSADGDVPTGLPEEYHMAIVYKALFDYGAFEDAREQVDRARVRYGELFDNMLWTQIEHPELVVVPQ